MPAKPRSARAQSNGGGGNLFRSGWLAERCEDPCAAGKTPKITRQCRSGVFLQALIGQDLSC